MPEDVLLAECSGVMLRAPTLGPPHVSFVLYLTVTSAMLLMRGEKMKLLHPSHAGKI